MNPQKKFWKWRNQADGEPEARVLELYGTIASESWFDDDVTPQMFKDELFAEEGDVVIFLNSPGGDCIAASQIYTMLMEYTGNVTIKIDGIAASAASVIAMAGTSVLMAPTSLMMIHNPMTAAFGSKDEMEKAIEMLEEVKESIINAYELRTGLSRARISHLMDSETWMNAKRAIELGFADGMLTDEKVMAEMPAFEFSDRAVEMALINKITAKTRKESPVNKQEPEPKEPQPEPAPKHGRSVDELMERLHLLNN
ncbi:MAG: Clp protease ClpP [Oscillospiraceae bacterium]|nr:Clp protease ClpP [Oscillospiraceae bacterium]